MSPLPEGGGVPEPPQIHLSSAGSGQALPGVEEPPLQEAAAHQPESSDAAGDLQALTEPHLLPAPDGASLKQNHNQTKSRSKNEESVLFLQSPLSAQDEEKQEDLQNSE